MTERVAREALGTAPALDPTTAGPERTLEPGLFQVIVGGLSASLEVTSGGTVAAAVETFPPAPRTPARPPPPSVPPGTGTGLVGEYYTSAPPVFFHSLKKKVVDPKIDFDPFVDKLKAETGQGELCAVRWTGWIEAQHSENYTIYTRTDDGVRLWIDGKLLIDFWADRAATEDYNNMTLLAGRRYPIEIEFYQGRGAAMAQLSWSSLSVPKGIIPRTQLYSDLVPETWFRRADFNSDEKVDLSDPMSTLTHLFLAGEASECPDASDADDSGLLDISDAIYTLNFLFLAGTAPTAPGPEHCGTDPTADNLPACVHEIENCD